MRQLSQRMEFASLPVDCKLDIVKYLTISDCVRYERVNTDFGDLMDSVWRQRQSLVVSVSSSHDFIDYGHRRRKRARRVQDVDSLNVVHRTPNVK